MTIDVTIINKVPFMIIAAHSIHLRKVKLMQDMKISTFDNSKMLEQVIQAFHGRGFRVHNIIGMENVII